MNDNIFLRLMDNDEDNLGQTWGTRVGGGCAGLFEAVARGQSGHQLDRLEVSVSSRAAALQRCH